MKTIIGMFIVLLLPVLIACSNDSGSWDDSAIGISVPTIVFDADKHSRTSMSGSTAIFTNNDVIGVSETLTGKSNIAFSYSGAAWATTTPMYWYNRTATHTFYAYYPYNSSSQGLSAVLPILTQQNVLTVPDATCDMLVTTSPVNQARSSSTSVSLPMRHAFALLRFDIKMSLLSLINPYSLDSLIVRGGNATGQSNPYGMFNTVNDVSKISYNLSTNALNLSVNNNTVYSQYLRKAPPSVNISKTAISVYVLVLPGTYANPVPAVNLRLSTLNLLPKNTGFITLPNSSSFVAGNMYVYQVSIGLNLTRSVRNIMQNDSILSVVIKRSSP